MASELTRLTVWGLDNLLSIDSIPSLLGKNYNLIIDFLADEDISEREKTLYNKWLSSEGLRTISEQTRNIVDNDIIYVDTIASYEWGFGDVRSFVNGSLLPRDVRVFQNKCPVIFYEFESKVYCVVQISDSQEWRLRSHLLGQKKGAKMEEWGDITAKRPLPYHFDSKFYYWLLSKKGQTLELNNKEVKFIDVSALSLLSDRNVYNSSSEGPALLDGSLSALSGLGSNESITIVGLKIKIDNTTLTVKFGKDGVSYIDREHCYKEEDGEITTYSDDSSYFILLIYGFIYPQLLRKYDEDVSLRIWDTQNEAVQRKQWALKVIRQLAKHNDILESEIRQCLASSTG